MSIIDAKKAYQSGWGKAGLVQSGTMSYTSNGGEFYTFKVSIPGREALTEYRFEVKKNQDWKQVLPEMARRAVEAIEKAKEPTS